MPASAADGRGGPEVASKISRPQITPVRALARSIARDIARNAGDAGGWSGEWPPTFTAQQHEALGREVLDELLRLAAGGLRAIEGGGDRLRVERVAEYRRWLIERQPSSELTMPELKEEPDFPRAALMLPDRTLRDVRRRIQGPASPGRPKKKRP